MKPILTVACLLFMFITCYAQNDSIPSSTCTFTIDLATYGSIDFTTEQYGWAVYKDGQGNTKDVNYAAVNSTLKDVTYPTLYKPNPDPNKSPILLMRYAIEI